jgi:hypothetical protein
VLSLLAAVRVEMRHFAGVVIVGDWLAVAAVG